ncbi:MAG: hypothetical protein H6819_05450 [Phycisphaerales bacterium]|nr:hypothetical protein [Phycisphaerales bacterium]MCB9854775.1 hypothetical protein [Phycisphaerales bacterium]MCB9863753.1 hypothetical protein [Phycisphaerales bacterium]
MSGEIASPASAFAGFQPAGWTECPICEYSLKGLPAVHACPECGFRYDTNTRIWIAEPRKKQPSDARVVIFIPLTVIGFLAVRWAGPILGVILYLILLLLVGAIIKLDDRRRSAHPWSPPLIGIGVEVIFHRCSKGKVRIWPLQDIKDVRQLISSDGDVLCLELKDDRSRMLKNSFRSSKAMQAFVDTAKARLAGFQGGHESSNRD